MSYLKNFRIFLLIFVQILLIVYSCDKNSTGPDTSNYVLSFDGIDDIITIDAKNSYLNNITSEFTVASWIFIESFPNIAPRIIDRSDNKYGAPAGDRMVFSLFKPDSAVALNINGYVVKSNKIPLEEWIHVAGTYDGAEIKIYVNGKLNNSLNHIDSLNVTESKLYFGNEDSLSLRQFHGYIDEIHIWNVCKNESEIKKDMTIKLSGSESGLISYWCFDEGSGQIVADKSKNKINGYLGISDASDSSDPVWVEFKFPFIN